ncbi:MULTISPECIES: SMI1/KNR4 family protein [Virgibacillus]|uniref:SMI1 / KNR4 family protein n=1 Tax=Virgibacillus massiliensis TaxID=1462526 RepID=A0A024Q7F1_9BACI|nr:MULTISPECIES: SMI1/KNR4 family protein [Virgibacillus]CDQ38222.1 SMI1 / KNR4 family protein [Virgibacillus massiliensis]
MNEGLIYRTISNLKQALKDNILLVPNSNGQPVKMHFQFNEPISKEEINQVEQFEEITLPSDYLYFLSLHNGATLFEPWYGGQFELYRLINVSKTKRAGLFPENCYPIGDWNGEYLLIDVKKTKDDHYLLWWDSSIESDTKDLQMNFSYWLYQFIVTKGSKFWEK